MNGAKVDSPLEIPEDQNFKQKILDSNSSQRYAVQVNVLPEISSKNSPNNISLKKKGQFLLAKINNSKKFIIKGQTVFIDLTKLQWDHPILSRMQITTVRNFL